MLVHPVPDLAPPTPEQRLKTDLNGVTKVSLSEGFYDFCVLSSVYKPECRQVEIQADAQIVAFKLSVSPEVTALIGDIAEPTVSCESGSPLVTIYGQAGMLAARKFVEALQVAIRRSDSTAVTRLFRYPFTIRAQKDILVRTPGAFKQNYSAYLSPKTRQEILEASAACLFANDQGIMLGNGTIWFDEADDDHVFKAFIVNPAK